jgi:hypothetical protein
VLPASVDGCLPVVRHYVIGVARENLDTTCTVVPSPNAATASSGEHSLRALCASVGFGIIHTQMAGDCGIDVMAYFSSEPRTVSTFKSIRMRLAAFMDSVAFDPVWQNAYRACGEVDDPPDVSTLTLPSRSCSPPAEIHTPGAGVNAVAALDKPSQSKMLSLASASFSAPPLPPPLPEELDFDSGATSFPMWLRSIDAESLSSIITSAEQFKVVELEWYRRHRLSLPEKSKTSKRGPLAASRLNHRLGVGIDFGTWLKQQTDPKVLRSRYRSYAKHRWGYDFVPNKVRVWVQRCEIEALKASASSRILLPSGKVARASGAASGSLSCRKRHLQGRPFKAAFVREELFDWFVSLKAAICGRLSPKVVRVKASSIIRDAVAEMRRTGKFMAVPVISKGWLSRWKKEYGICLRKPNRKFKVTLPKLKGRLRAMWLTTFRLRALALCVLGHDLTMEGIDQKGLHLNELGSKNMPTLCLRGAPEVPLKENHAHTRQRFSLMTTVTSCAERATGDPPPPIEVLFKGETARVLKDIEVPPNANMSLAFGPKGQPEPTRPPKTSVSLLPAGQLGLCRKDTENRLRVGFGQKAPTELSTS